jgi:hypothetical protein
VKLFNSKASAFCVAAILWLGATFVHAQNRRALSGHLPRTAALPTRLGRLEPTEPLVLAIGLPLRNQNDLQILLQELYDPASPNFHHYLTPQQFTEKFGPGEQDYQNVIDFVRSHGLAVTTTYPGRMLLEVKGAAENVEKTFEVRLLTYRHPSEQRTYYAPEAEPSVPAEIPILDISGLDNYSEPRPLTMEVVPLPSPSEARPDDWTGLGPGGSFITTDFRTAYALGVSEDGAGQSVGLLELDACYPIDIRNYERATGLPDVRVAKVLLAGFDGAPGKANGEVALDTEMAMAMAPGLSEVIQYEAPNLVANYEVVLLRMAEDDAAGQLSSSWAPPSGPSSTLNQILRQIAAQGQSFFQASGDNGAYATGVNEQGGAPYLTGVGGTYLNTYYGYYEGETVWNVGTGDLASGGGISTLYRIPSWQEGIDMSANGGSTNWRNSPDVAMVAAQVYATLDNGKQGAAQGTSVAAPLWAAFTAMINQQAAGNGLPNVGFLNPAIYTVGQGANYSACFNDVTSGNNTTTFSPDQFYAVPGYDLCTGWGSPAGQPLLDVLTTQRAELAITPGLGFAATGFPGGPFSVNELSVSVMDSGWMPLNWSIGNDSAWLDVSTNGGTLLPNQPGVMFDVSLNAAAANLGPGNYSATLVFSNLTDGTEQSLLFTLQVWQSGALQVTLSPPAAVQAGAQWNVDGGPWQNSGAIVSGLLSTAHTVNFAAIPNWTTPPSQTLTLIGDQTNSLTGVYGAQYGSLTVTLAPTDALIAGAHWQVDGGEWMDSGATVTNLLAITHNITFATLAGWVTPSNQAVMINGSAGTTNAGVYSEMYEFRTIAASTNGTNTAAPFSSPSGIAVDANGNLFVADTGNDVIRELTPQGTNWMVNTIAGMLGQAGASDGTNGAAQFNAPFGIAVDAGDNLYVTDSGNHVTRQLSATGTNWAVATIGVSHLTFMPAGIAVDANSNVWETEVYIDLAGSSFDTLYDFSRSASGWTVNSFQGGYFDLVDFGWPYGVAIDPAEGAYVVNAEGNDILKLAPGTSPYYGFAYTTAVVAGSGAAGGANGTAATAQFSYPQGIAADAFGNVYVADTGNSTVRKLLPFGSVSAGSPNYEVMTIGGIALNPGSGDGTSALSRFNSPLGLAVDSNETVYVADTGNHIIRIGSSFLRSVQVLASPGDTNVQSAQFQVDGGAWASIGSTVRLSVGEHTISFETIPGWATPSDQTIYVSSSQTVTGVYIEQFGSLQLTIGPPKAVAAGARWQLDGGAWQLSGVTLSNLQTGLHQLAFTNIPHWVAPTNNDVLLTVGSNTLFVAYIEGSPKVSVSITSPMAGQKWTNQTFTLSGVVTDNVAVPSVWYQINSNGWMEAVGTNQWRSAPMFLAPGTVKAQAYAVDTSGNFSKTNQLVFVNDPTAPLTLTISGNGTVSPNLNGHYLSVGQSYTVTAKPAPGSVFSNWSGDFSATTPALAFIVQTNTSLQANFVPTPFPPFAGNYQGLFYDAKGVAAPSSGFFSALVSDEGTFSASLQMEGESYGLSGGFSADGTASNYIARSINPITLQLRLDLSHGTGLTGELSAPNWDASLTAYLSPFSKTLAAPEMGSYTLDIPAGKSSSLLPGGAGFGAATVDALGHIEFTGMLGDGTAISQSVIIVQNGLWPFYVSLYSGNGAIFGWLAFTNSPTNDLAGSLTWLKTPQPSAAFYPSGFSVRRDAEGSVYNYSKGQPILNFGQGQLWLAGGNLGAPFTNQVSLGGNGIVTNLSANALTLSISTVSGLFHGSVADPATKKAIPINGAVLQKQNVSYGVFLGTNQTGQVYFGPTP